MRKIYVTELNGFLNYLQNKPDRVFRNSKSLQDIDDEIMIDFKDYISAQMFKKISSIAYKDLLFSYTFINNPERHKSMLNVNLANSIFNVYCDFLFKYSITAIYFYLRYNKKIFLYVDENIFGIFAQYLGDSFVRVLTSNILGKLYNQEYAVEDLVEILTKYNISYIDMGFNIDMDYVNYLYKCYGTSKGGYMFGNLL